MIFDPDDRKKIEIFLSCRSLIEMDTFSKSDPYVIIFLKNNDGQFLELGRTETLLNNSNPTFVKTIVLDFIFEI